MKEKPGETDNSFGLTSPGLTVIYKRSSLTNYIPSTDRIIPKLHSHKRALNSSSLASFDSFKSVASQLYPYQNLPAKGPTSKYLLLRFLDAMWGSVARRRVVSAPNAGGMLVSLTRDEVMNEIQGGREADSVDEEVPIVPYSLISS